MSARQSTSFALDAASTKILASFPSTVASGNSIVGYVTWDTTGATDIVSVGDEKSGASSFSIIDHITDGANNQGLASFSSLNVTTGASTVTVTLGASVTNKTIIISEYPNISSVSALDVHHMTNMVTPGTGADAIATSTIPTVFSGDLIYSGVIDTTVGTLNSVSTGTGYSIVLTNSAGSVHLKTQDFIQSSAGSVKGSWTDSVNGAADRYIVGFLALKAIAAAPPPNGGFYLQEDGTSKFLLEDGISFYLIESWSTSSVQNFPPFFIGDPNGIGSPGRFFKDRTS